MEIPYSFLDKQSCTEIAQWLYPDRQYACVVRPLESQFAALDTKVE